jgi:nicotinamide-nucleotide amidase
VEEAVGPDLEAAGLEVGYCARPGEVDLRLIGSQALLQQAEVLVRERLNDYIVTTGSRELEEVVVGMLAERGETLAVAESCTGGLIADRLTNVPGSSEVFLEGVVAYANEAKTRTLGVPGELLAKVGAVSSEVAAAMAEGCRQKAGSTYGLATTGIAGPGGGSPEKPVGTLHVGLARPRGNTILSKLRFPMDRLAFKTIASQHALDLLRRELRDTTTSDREDFPQRR